MLRTRWTLQRCQTDPYIVSGPVPADPGARLESRAPHRRARGLQAPEEAGPELGVLGVADFDAEDLEAPSAVTPVAITTGRERARSMSAQMCDTVDFDTPNSQPNALTRSSTFRVDVPVT